MLKNYTSTVSARQSINYIEEKLAFHKATQILKQYGATGRVAALSFTLIINNTHINFKLPARIEECEKALCRKVKKPRRGTEKRIREQAERTAWKIVSDWIDAQLAMVELAQVDFMEVFLPYVFDSTKNQTFYQLIKEDGYQNLLPAGKP